MSFYDFAEAVVLGVLFASPWIVAAVVLWPRRMRDGEVSPSMGELARRRYSV